MADIVDLGQAREKLDHAALIKERDAFEKELQEETGRRLHATIKSAVDRRLGTYDPKLHAAITGNLLGKFTADQDGMLKRLWELRELPMTDESRVRRLLEFERVLHHYLPEALREELHDAS
jgi:hypothetical protein